MNKISEIKYLLLLVFMISQGVVMAQSTSSAQDDDYIKSAEFFAQKDYESAYRHIQLSKLNTAAPSDEATVLEIQCLFHLKKYEPCTALIEYSISTINLSISSLNIISEIELKIKQYNDKKRIEVAKLRMIDKIKQEPSGWSSFLNSAKTSIKSLISN